MEWFEWVMVIIIIATIYLSLKANLGIISGGIVVGIVLFGLGGIHSCIEKRNTITPLSVLATSDKWERFYPRCNKVLALSAQKTEAPSWKLFGDTKTKGQLDQDINKLLDEALLILGTSELVKTFHEIREYRTKIVEYNQKISDLKTRRILADKKEVRRCDSEIEDHKDRIERIQEEIARLKKKLSQHFLEMGITLNDDQLEMLITGVTGDDDAKMFAVFHTVKHFTVQLKKLAADTGENIEVARKYYGVHTVLLKVLLRLQDLYVERIQKDYIPKLDKIVDDTEALLSQTNRLLKDSDDAHAQVYKANAEAQQLTLRAAALYSKYLKQNRERVRKAREKVYKEYQAALNTYETVTNAHILISLIRKADSFYKSLSELQVPDLVVFSNTEMKKEFEKLTIKMRR